MKKKKNWIITLIFLAFVLAFVQVTYVVGKSKPKANTTLREEVEEYIREKNREILAGLQGVGVVVEGFKPEVEKYGFNRERFKTDVELRLRQYGVKVLSIEEMLQVRGKPYLYINVSPLINEKGGDAAVHISVQLKEVVLLRRNPSIITTAITWNKGQTLLLGLKKLDKPREYVRDLVDMFINDYLAANPKDQPSKKDTTKEAAGKTIQKTYVVPENALFDMYTCAGLFLIISDPNLPQELTSLQTRGIELYAIQTLYLAELGIKPEDYKARQNFLYQNFLYKGDIKDLPPEVFDYINFEDLREVLNRSP